MERQPQLGVLAHAVAVAADVDDVAVVKDSVDERRRHDAVAHDLTPLLEALVGREHGGGALVAVLRKKSIQRFVLSLLVENYRCLRCSLLVMCTYPFAKKKNLRSI